MYVYKLADILFLYFYWLYKPLYYYYKKRKDRLEITWIDTILKEGDTVLDIGANIGFYSEIFAERVGKTGAVISFEPEKKNYRRLLQNIKKWSNIEAHSLAICHTPNTEITFYVSDIMNVNHTLYKPSTFSHSYIVPATTIDTFFETRPLPSLRLIKLDIQGGELSALQGMRQTLTTYPDCLLLMEVWPFGLADAGISVSSLFDFFVQEQLYIHLMEGATPREIQYSAIADMLNTKDFHFFINIVLSKQPL